MQVFSESKLGEVHIKHFAESAQELQLTLQSRHLPSLKYFLAIHPGKHLSLSRINPSEHPEQGPFSAVEHFVQAEWQLLQMFYSVFP